MVGYVDGLCEPVNPGGTATYVTSLETRLVELLLENLEL